MDDCVVSCGADVFPAVYSPPPPAGPDVRFMYKPFELADIIKIDKDPYRLDISDKKLLEGYGSGYCDALLMFMLRSLSPNIACITHAMLGIGINHGATGSDSIVFPKSHYGNVGMDSLINRAKKSWEVPNTGKLALEILYRMCSSNLTAVAGTNADGSSKGIGVLELLRGYPLTRAENRPNNLPNYVTYDRISSGLGDSGFLVDLLGSCLYIYLSLYDGGEDENSIKCDLHTCMCWIMKIIAIDIKVYINKRPQQRLEQSSVYHMMTASWQPGPHVPNIEWLMDGNLTLMQAILRTLIIPPKSSQSLNDIFIEMQNDQSNGVLSADRISRAKAITHSMVEECLRLSLRPLPLEMAKTYTTAPGYLSSSHDAPFGIYHSDKNIFYSHLDQTLHNTPQGRDLQEIFAEQNKLNKFIEKALDICRQEALYARQLGCATHCTQAWRQVVAMTMYGAAYAIPKNKPPLDSKNKPLQTLCKMCLQDLTQFMADPAQGMNPALIIGHGQMINDDQYGRIAEPIAELLSQTLVYCVGAVVNAPGEPALVPDLTPSLLKGLGQMIQQSSVTNTTTGQPFYSVAVRGRLAACLSMLLRYPVPCDYTSVADPNPGGSYGVEGGENGAAELVGLSGLHGGGVSLHCLLRPTGFAPIEWLIKYDENRSSFVKDDNNGRMNGSSYNTRDILELLCRDATQGPHEWRIYNVECIHHILCILRRQQRINSLYGNTFSNIVVNLLSRGWLVKLMESFGALVPLGLSQSANALESGINTSMNTSTNSNNTGYGIGRNGRNSNLVSVNDSKIEERGLTAIFDLFAIIASHPEGAAALLSIGLPTRLMDATYSVSPGTGLYVPTGGPGIPASKTTGQRSWRWWCSDMEYSTTTVAHYNRSKYNTNGNGSTINVVTLRDTPWSVLMSGVRTMSSLCLGSKTVVSDSLQNTHSTCHATVGESTAVFLDKHVRQLVQRLQLRYDFKLQPGLRAGIDTSTSTARQTIEHVYDIGLITSLLTSVAEVCGPSDTQNDIDSNDNTSATDSVAARLSLSESDLSKTIIRSVCGLDIYWDDVPTTQSYPLSLMLLLAAVTPCVTTWYGQRRITCRPNHMILATPHTSPRPAVEGPSDVVLKAVSLATRDETAGLGARLLEAIEREIPTSIYQNISSSATWTLYHQTQLSLTLSLMKNTSASLRALASCYRSHAQLELERQLTQTTINSNNQGLIFNAPMAVRDMHGPQCLMINSHFASLLFAFNAFSNLALDLHQRGHSYCVGATSLVGVHQALVQPVGGIMQNGPPNTNQRKILNADVPDVPGLCTTTCDIINNLAATIHDIVWMLPHAAAKEWCDDCDRCTMVARDFDEKCFLYKTIEHMRVRLLNLPSLESQRTGSNGFISGLHMAQGVGFGRR
jgi:hypothetical protein